MTGDERLRWLAIVCLALAVVALGCAGSQPIAVQPPSPLPAYAWSDVHALEVFGQYVFPRARIGGVSGLAYDEKTGGWIAVSDSRLRAMWFPLRIALGPEVAVSIGRGVRFRAPGAAADWRPDYEAIVTLPNGRLLIASEGNLVERVRYPAAIWEYERDGRHVSSLPLPAKFLPAAGGDVPRGLRDNHGFEGMALDARASRLWAVSETPLLQDDDLPDLSRGARARMIEWAVANGSFAIVRELVYPIEAIGTSDRLPAGAEIVDQGVSDLTVLPDGTIVSLERAFVRHKPTNWSTNIIRLFRVDLDEADDVSSVESLRDAPSARPVRKHLIADLSTFASQLDRRLAALENFEAVAPGPPTPDGRPTLLVMSDDNFSERQVTALLVLVAARTQ